MNLSDWLKEREMTATEFAAQTDLAVSTITRCIKGERRPDWPTLDKIMAATDGAVTPNDFIADEGAAA